MSVLYVGSSEISPILDVTQNQKTFNILEYKQSDHILNDIRWLRANTNSWQSGEMYESAYAALVEYKRTATLKSHTINNITVPYYLAENGFKIVVAEQAENVDNLYNTQGFADYFILDVDNKQFKLPRRSNRRIIKSQKASKDNNYSWYNIYSDGWVEQGGKVLTVEDSAVDVVFPVEMVDANQYLFHGNAIHELALNTASLYLKTITHSATGVSVVGVANMGATTIYQAMEFEWEVFGAAAESEYADLDDVLYDYYYVGEFEQTALMQTAGIVSEQLNGLDKYIDDKFYSKMTNCITHIPQDIKLEMSDDEKLIIKAGSKVYIPNGPGVFDSVVIPNDITVGGWGSLTGIIIISSGGTGASFTGLSQVSSGATEPTISSGNVWYDTENNIVKRSSDGSSWGTIKHSLPIAIVTANNSTPNGASGIASIDQVFNGFGYIGSTAFVLPGVKGLAPYGRNSDGTLKNLEVNVNEVITTTDVSGATGGLWYTLNSNAITRVNFGTFTYDKEKNKYRDNNSGSYNNTFVLIDSSAYRKDGKVEKFNPIMPLSITDRSDTDFIATQAMPSNKYIDLTLGATDSYYTAPADGYFFVAKTGDINQFLNGYITPNNSTTRIIGTSRMASVNGTVLVLFLPVSKGQRLFLTYTATGDTTYFKFIYANGSK